MAIKQLAEEKGGYNLMILSQYIALVNFPINVRFAFGGQKWWMVVQNKYSLMSDFLYSMSVTTEIGFMIGFFCK